MTRLDALILTHFTPTTTNGGAAAGAHGSGIADCTRCRGGEPERQALLSEAEAHGTQVLLLDENAQLTLGQADIQIYRPMGDGEATRRGCLCWPPRTPLTPF